MTAPGATDALSFTDVVTCLYHEGSHHAPGGIVISSPFGLCNRALVPEQVLRLPLFGSNFAADM